MDHHTKSIISGFKKTGASATQSEYVIALCTRPKGQGSILEAEIEKTAEPWY
ncbi:hypothetical protein WAI453_011749 [Rhynchosporium graminicola]